MIDEAGLRFDTTALAASLETANKAQDPHKALADLVDLNRHALATLQSVGYDSVQPPAQLGGDVRSVRPLLATTLAEQPA